MDISGIIWLEKIVEKLARKHHLTQDEVEEVFVNTPQYRFIERGKIEGEMYMLHTGKLMPDGMSR